MQSSLATGLAHQPGKSLGAAVAWDQSQVDFRLPEFRRFGGIDEITGHGHLSPSSQGKTIDAGDDREWKILKAKPEGMPFL